MPAFLSSLLSGVGLKVLGGAAAILTVAAILFGAKQAGRNSERVESLQRTVENARAARKIERETAALGDDDLDEFLRPPSRRR